LQNEELKKYLLEKKKNNPFSAIQNKPVTSVSIQKIPVKKMVPVQPAQSVYHISKENKEALQKFKQQLVFTPLD
jgi:hypothetical protein